MQSLKIKSRKCGAIAIVCLTVSVFISCNSSQISNESPKIDATSTPTRFKNPILSSGADPWVYKNGSEYFVTFTTGNNITLMRTEKMSELKNGTKQIIWTPPSSGFNSKEIWAPELHKINGKWYVYYAASDGDNINHKMWVLENTSQDPFLGTWVDKGELKLPDDKWAIDGTYIEINNEYYFAWSGWSGDTNVSQNLYIVKLETPFTVSSERVCLLKPTAAWETNNTNPLVAEAPQFLVRDNKVFLFYSAGGCWTDGYSIGMISMDASKNPLDVNSWTRSENNPLFKSNTTGNSFGPGHNSFFKSHNGKEDWILYHANPLNGQGCGENRSMRMQQFTWDKNGFPVFGIPESLNKELIIPGGE